MKTLSKCKRVKGTRPHLAAAVEKEQAAQPCGTSPSTVANNNNNNDDDAHM